MKSHNLFIEKYKELEKLLPMTVREYEDTLSEEEAQKMRLCRLNRNYIQHNADYEKIISISPGLQSFLNDIVDKIHRQSGILKDSMVSLARYGILSENDTLIDAAALMSKRKRTSNIVLDKNGEYIGNITKELISDCFGEGTITKTTKIAKFKDKLTILETRSLLQTTPMDIVNAEIGESKAVVLVRNASGRIVGVYNA